MTEKAYAKINLGLKILGRRADGFHEILSLMQTVSLCDILSFSERPDGIDVRCSGVEGVPEGEENLAYKAAATLKKEFNVRKGAAITIRKQIPVGSGLGGGSSDAAAALLGLNRLWQLGAKYSELLPIAASIGSDVPFLLQKGTAIASGKGEILQYLKLTTPIVCVLVYPGFSVSTKWAYNSRKNSLTSGTEYVSFISSLRKGNLGKELPYQCLENDFEQAVGQRYSVIGEMKGKLLSAGARAASLSGSGSAVYGIFDDHTRANQAAQALQRAAWSVFVCHPVG